MSDTGLTVYDLAQIVRAITYRDADNYKVDWDVDTEDRIWFEVVHLRPDAITGEPTWGHGGRRYIGPTTTRSELVRAIFEAFLAYEEHEVREFFRYRGVQIFGPHIDVDALAEVADRTDYVGVPAERQAATS